MTVEVPTVLHHRRLYQPQRWTPGKQHLQRALQFQSRQRGPHAEVDAGTEAGVPGLRCPGQIRVGMRLHTRIAPRGAQHQRDLLTAPQRDTAVVRVVQHVALEEMQRRGEAQRFLHHVGQQRVVAYGAHEVRRMLEQGTHGIPQGVHGGLMPGVQQQDDRTHQFGLRQPGAILLGRYEDRQQIVARRVTTRRDQLAYEGREVGRGRVGLHFDRLAAPHPIHGHHVV